MLLLKVQNHLTATKKSANYEQSDAISDCFFPAQSVNILIGQ